MITTGRLAALAAALALATASGVGAEVVSTTGGASYEIAAGRGQATLLLNEKTGSSEAALSRLSLRGGAQVQEHIHEKSAEFLYVISGEMTLTIDGQSQTLRAGDAVRIPAGHKHAGGVAANVDRVELVQIYVGPGPEARFTAGKRLSPPATP